MSQLYEENLWGKIDYLHERYQREHNHISNFLDMMGKYQNACFNFSKEINNILSKNYILSESNTSSLHKSMQNFYKCLLTHSQAFKETFDSIKINILPVTKSISESYQKEKEMYNSYSKIRSTYNNNRANLEKTQKDFNLKCKECETLVYNAKKARIYKTAPSDQISKMENKATEHLTNTALFEDKYIQLLKETNKSRENEINTQKKLQSYYQNIDFDYYGKTRMMTGFFVSCLKRLLNSISLEVEDLNHSYNEINIENDVKEFVEKNKGKNKPEPFIKFIPYKPAPELGNDISSYLVTEPKSLEISFEVIKVFRKIFKYIRTDLDMEEERKKNILRIYASKIFRPSKTSVFTQKEKDDFYLMLRNKKQRSDFIQILKQEAKVCNKTEKLIRELVELFLYILEIAQSDNDYQTGLSIILLSQSFYYEKLNKIKNTKDREYLFNEIKDNKWLNQIEFWEGMIILNIQKEMENNDELKTDDEKEKKNTINKIVYSKIFIYSINMLDFNIIKDDIFSLVEKLCKKYELDKKDYDSIINNINNKINQKKKNVEIKKNIYLTKIDEKVKKSFDKKRRIRCFKFIC